MTQKICTSGDRRQARPGCGSHGSLQGGRTCAPLESGEHDIVKLAHERTIGRSHRIDSYSPGRAQRTVRSSDACAHCCAKAVRRTVSTSRERGLILVSWSLASVQRTGAAPHVAHRWARRAHLGQRAPRGILPLCAGRMDGGHRFW